MPIIPRESLREKLRRCVLKYGDSDVHLLHCHQVPGKSNLLIGMGSRYGIFRVLTWWYSEQDEWEGINPFDCLEEFCRDYRSKASADKYLRKLEAYLQDPDTTILHVKSLESATAMKQRWKDRTEHLDER